MKNKKKTQSSGRHFQGFTIIEILVGVAIFLLISTAVYEMYVGVLVFITQNHNKILALSLGNEQFEIARNLSYADLGVQGSIPNGKIPHVQQLSRGGTVFTVTTTIRNIDLPFDGTLGGAPNDSSPADNKMVEVEIDCSTCKDFSPLTLTSTVAPKNLETASTNGALFIEVFDANGVAVSGAGVHIENNQIIPHINIDDVTDVNGRLQIVDAPPGVEAYEITVTKAGYSTDKTYPTGGGGNPAPSRPHVTVLLQQVTQVSFSIDRFSELSFSSVTSACAPVPSFDFSMVGSKLIGAGVYKYSQNHATDGGGLYSGNAFEWDSYALSGIDASYDIVGVNPLNPIAVNPGATENISLIVALKNPKRLLVTVKDSATGLPVTDAEVTLTDNASYEDTQTTGKGYINQTDWSGGSGQNLFTDPTKYATGDGNIHTGVSGQLTLANVFGSFRASGELESSTIDTGSASNFYNIVWLPTDEPAGTGAGSVRFQFATSASSTPSSGWVFKGPDGTGGSYYSSAATSIAAVHTGDRYARYKVFLATNDTALTPNISDIAFTFTSSCTPPGQVVFSGLAGGNYHITVTKSGYSAAAVDVSVASSWQEKEIILTP